RLFVNSHQPFEGPVAWYEAHLKSDEGLDIIGGTFPGFPLIGHGVRPELGWAFTVNLPDLTDIYELTLNPENENEYLLDGEYVPFEREEAKIAVKLFGFIPWTVSQEVIWSKHGPALRTDHGVFAIRFPGMDDMRALDQYLAMNTATNFDEWRDAMRINAIPSFNVVYADQSGTIAHFHNSRFPKRKAEAGINWRGVVPGDRSDLIWTEEYGFDKVPSVVRPKSGFVFSANSTPFDVTDGPDNPDRNLWPSELWVEERYTNRAHRIKETYGVDKSITRAEFIDYKYDLAYSEKSQIAEGIREILAADFSSQPALQAAQQHLSAWDYQTNMENRQAALAIYSFFPSIAAEVKGEEWPSPLPGFKQAVETLTDKFGTYDLEWGKVNRIRRGEVNMPVNGGPDIVRAIYDVDGPEADGGLMATVGDCYIALAEWAPDGTQTLATVHQFGSAASRPNSPHYADQVPLFAGQQLKPMTFDWQAITKAAKVTYRPGE
ncbi:MAG: penicillin acylase family protein, partial [Alphaproteobacteria bacterium]